MDVILKSHPIPPQHPDLTKLIFRVEEEDSLGALPVTVILAIQRASVAIVSGHRTMRRIALSKQIQIKCFGLGCEINLQIPNSPADV